MKTPLGRVDSWVHEDADSRKEQRRQGVYTEINDAAEQRTTSKMLRHFGASKNLSEAPHDTSPKDSVFGDVSCGDREYAPQGPKCPHALIAGSRASNLALIQSSFVIERLESYYPALEILLKTYKTQGDLMPLTPTLSPIGGEGAKPEASDKGLFVKELEYALLEGTIDFAVHSMKDMPSDFPPHPNPLPQGGRGSKCSSHPALSPIGEEGSEQPEVLQLIPFGEREVPFDAFVSRSGKSFYELEPGSVIGTSSVRRQAVLKSIRPELNFQSIRGNVETRLKKMEEGSYDALVLAAAGLYRLNLEEIITHIFSPSELIPACCQGVLAIETYSSEVLEIFKPFVHTETDIATRAERSFLRTIQGGCHVPMGAYAAKSGEDLYHIEGMICSLESGKIVTYGKDFSSHQATEAGEAVAREIMKQIF